MLVAATALLARIPAPDRGRGRRRPRRRALPLHRLPQDHRRRPRRHRRRRCPTCPPAGAAVGARLPRLDGRAKVDGSERFGADACAAGRPHPQARSARRTRAPPSPSATSRGWAAARPGVAAVLTAADIPGRNRFGVIPRFADQPALAEAETRFPGEPVALVALEDPGADLAGFPVAWSPLPALADPAAAEAAGRPGRAPRAPRQPPDRGPRPPRRRRRSRSPPAPTSSPATIATPFVEHAPIETEAGAAWLDGDTLVIRACTQAPYLDRDETAAILALPPERVRILPSAVGGGFGTKLDLSVQPLLGLAALEDRPPGAHDLHPRPSRCAPPPSATRPGSPPASAATPTAA